MSDQPSRMARLYLGAPDLWRELLSAAVCLAVGLLVMPCLIFACGRLALGPYAHGNLFTLWREYLQGLAAGSEVSWFILLGPYLLLWVVRGGRQLLLHKRATPQP